jgi:DNA polymerase-4
LVGISLDSLVEDEGVKQLTLGERANGWRQADKAIDRIKGRFGAESLRPARLVEDHGDE